MTNDWKAYASELRASRERLQNLRVDDPAIPACIAGLSRIEELLRRPVRIAVMGEYNSGKTSVTDMIIGRGLLPRSAVANTGIPVGVAHGSKPALFGINGDGVMIRIDGTDDPLTDLDYRGIEIRLPLPWLEDHHVLDTPPTEAPAEFAAISDIVIWCTVATRAWTESERHLWSSMPARCLRNALLVATHKDSFYSDDDCEQVLRRLNAMTKALFRDILLVSAAEKQLEADEPPESAGVSPEDAPVLLAAIERSAAAIRDRRLTAARRIMRRLARLALHEFGRNTVRPEAGAALAAWSAVTDRILAEHQAGRSPLQKTYVDLLQAFAIAAETLQPGVMTRPNGHHIKQTPAAETAGPSRSGSERPAALRADLTAVLRLLASTSRFEAPDAREQRNAARAILIALADLDATFADVGRWLTVNRSLAGELLQRQSA